MSDPYDSETRSLEDSPPRSVLARPEYLIFGGLIAASLVAIGLAWFY